MRGKALIAVACCCWLAGCGAAGPPKSGGAGGAPAAPRQVRLARVDAGTIPRVVTVTGTLAAREQVTLAMKVSGRLASIEVDLGSTVSEGQELARLDAIEFELLLRQTEAAIDFARARLGLGAEPADDEEFDAEATSLVRQASATLEEARQQRDRARKLSQDALVPESELDTKETEFQVAEGRRQDALEEVISRWALLRQRRWELELARQRLADAVLRAPWAGAVSERHATAGQYLAIGQAVVTLVRVDPLRLRLAIPERDSWGIEIGQPARIKVTGSPLEHTGEVARLSPVIAENSRTLMIEVDVPNADGLLRPGAFATAEVETAAAQPVALLPQGAIVSFAGIEKVFVVREGKAAERTIRTGRTQGELVEVLDGLEVGEQVIVDPGNLVGGQAVTIEN